MKKKIVKVCVCMACMACMACMVCIVACGKEKTKTPEEMVGQTVNEEIESGKPAGMDIVTEVAAYVSVTASQEYQFGKDQQTWF